MADEVYTVEIHTGDHESNEIAYEGYSFFEAKDVFYRLLVDENRPFFLGVSNPMRSSVIYSSQNEMRIHARRIAANSLRSMGLL